MLLENSNEVFIMLFADVLDTEVFNSEREADRAPFMRPKVRCDLTLFVALLVESFSSSCLAIRPTCGRPYIPCVDFFFKVVVGDNVL